MYFFDRTRGVTIPKALIEFGLPVKFFQAEFPDPETPDDVWLPTAGANDWIVVTHDTNFVNVPSERQAIVDYTIGCFVVAGAESPTWERVQILARAWPKIERLAANTERPFVWQIYANGVAREIYLVG